MIDPVDGCPDEQVLVALALGELSGRARADALGHVVGCRRCREEVDALIDVSEQLLLAAPEAEPPPGFESAVLGRIDPHRGDSPRRLRHLVALAGAAAAVLVVVLGLLVATRDASNLAEAAMITPSGHDVGRIWSHDGDRSWIFVSVPGWRVWDDPAGATRNYELRAELDDGSTADLGPIQFGGEDGSWGTTVDVDAGRIRSVAIVDDTGRVWCQGRF